MKCNCCENRIYVDMVTEKEVFIMAERPMEQNQLPVGINLNKQQLSDLIDELCVAWRKLQ